MLYLALKAGNFYQQLCDFYIDPSDSRYPSPDQFISNSPACTVRALSWKEPFGSLMLCGKQETRTWNTNVRGYVLICTSRMPYSIEKTKEIAGTAQFERIDPTLRQLTDTNLYKPLSVGYAIGIGVLTDSRPMRPDDCDQTFVAYRAGLYVHEYRDVHPIIPFAWKGSQGFRILSIADIKKISIVADPTATHRLLRPSLQ